MNKYTREEILQAVREELIEANKDLGISNGLTDKDYTFIGVVASSIKRLETKNTTENILKNQINP